MLMPDTWLVRVVLGVCSTVKHNTRTHRFKHDRLLGIHRRTQLPYSS